MSSSLWYFLLGAVVFVTTCYATDDGQSHPGWSAAEKEKMKGIKTRLNEVMKKVCDASVTEDKLKKVDECAIGRYIRDNSTLHQIYDQCYTQVLGEKTKEKLQDLWCKMSKHDRARKFHDIIKCFMQKREKTPGSPRPHGRPSAEEHIRHHEEKATCLEAVMAWVS